MKCIIPGSNIKVFGRAIHSLSKIGDELYIEPLDHGDVFDQHEFTLTASGKDKPYVRWNTLNQLALRTVNSSRSAYACFLFAPSFFQHYDDGGGQVDSQDSDDDALRCKIAMKSILTVFKSLSTMEKTVERCKINLLMKESRLVFTLHCRHGIVKTHNLAFIECETLQAVFSKDLCPNSLTASSRLLCDAVLNFQNNQEEITLIVSPEKILLKNYVDDEPDPNKVMHTNLTLDPDEFDNCQVGVDTEVTFCLKELRAILAFSEVTTLPLTLQFETAGKPIVFSIDSDSTFEGNFVLATLADQQSQSQAPPRAKPSTQKRSAPKPSSRPIHYSHNQPGTSNSRQKHNGSSASVNQSRADPEIERSQRLEAAYDELMNDDNDFEEMLIDNNTTVHVESDRNMPSTSRTDSNSDNRLGQGRVSEKGDNLPTVSERIESSVGGSSKEESPVLPMLGTKVKFSERLALEDDDDDEPVPGTPPAKRFKSLFFGSQASQTQKTENLSKSHVLAEDTDEED